MAATPTTHGFRRLQTSKRKVTWDNVAFVSPATAKKLGIRANNFGPIYKVAEKLGNDIDFDIVADIIEIKSPLELPLLPRLSSPRVTRTIRFPLRWDTDERASPRFLMALDSMRIRFARRRHRVS